MPFVQASHAIGKAIAEHHTSKIAEIRAQIAADDAKAARPAIQAIRDALAPRITPDNIDQHIATTQRDIEQARADAAHPHHSNSYKANAKERIRNSTQKLNKLNELKASLDQTGGGHEPPPHVVAKVPTKAKRGDVVAFVHQHSASYVNGPNQTHTRVTIGEVTAATRDGQVKEFRDYEGGAPRKVEHAGLQHAQRYILPSEKIADKAGIEEMVRSRGFLAGSGNYKPFESIEEAHAAIRPHVGGAAKRGEELAGAINAGRTTSRSQHANNIVDALTQEAAKRSGGAAPHSAPGHLAAEVQSAARAHNYEAARQGVLRAAEQGRATLLPAGARDNNTARVLIDGVDVGQASSLTHLVHEEVAEYRPTGRTGFASRMAGEYRRGGTFQQRRLLPGAR